MDGLFWLILIVSLWVGILYSASRGSGRNNRSLERKVDLILKHLGIDPNRDVHPQILELLKEGRKIQAIKLYRELTGAGLKEAKDYVESL